MSTCERVLYLALTATGSLTLCFVMVLTVLDVFGRYFFNSPISGGTELIEFGIAILIFSLIPVISWKNKHINVDILSNYLPKRVVEMQFLVSAVIAAGGYYIIGRRVFDYAARSSSRNLVSEYLEVPASYIQYFIGSMCFITMAALLMFFILPRLQNVFTPEK